MLGQKPMADYARELGINYATLSGWVRRGIVKLPDDCEALRQVRRTATGRYLMPTNWVPRTMRTGAWQALGIHDQTEVKS